MWYGTTVAEWKGSIESPQRRNSNLNPAHLQGVNYRSRGPWLTLADTRPAAIQ